MFGAGVAIRRLGRVGCPMPRLDHKLDVRLSAGFFLAFWLWLPLLTVLAVTLATPWFAAP